MKKIDKYFLFYLVLIGSIVIAGFCDSDLVKIFSMLFFLSFISLQEILAYKEREKADRTFKKDVDKQFEALKNEINKINMQFFKMR